MHSISCLIFLFLVSVKALLSPLFRDEMSKSLMVRKAFSSSEQETVRMFGAKLDVGLAGSRAVSRAEIQSVLKEDTSTEKLPAATKAEIFYAEAVDTLNRGNYKRSVELLSRACWFAGTGSRRGGQMQLWLAQALYAADNRSQSFRLLTALEKHPDRDVRTVASELGFILQAPELKLNASSYVSFDINNFNDDSVYQRRPDGTIVKQQTRKLPEEPEYGSIEWAQMQDRYEPTTQQIDLPTIIASTLIFITGLLFFH
mmetsp:Transcript_2700/g.3690  ORF Transcript_2700/g.3690 Transcript_2700/m.3690 type:complete len:257 (+) Transcript_2700:50-820(+)